MCNTIAKSHIGVDSYANELSYITIGGSRCIIISELIFQKQV